MKYCKNKWWKKREMCLLRKRIVLRFCATRRWCYAFIVQEDGAMLLWYKKMVLCFCGIRRWYYAFVVQENGTTLLWQSTVRKIISLLFFAVLLEFSEKTITNFKKIDLIKRECPISDADWRKTSYASLMLAWSIPYVEEGIWDK